MSDQDTAFFFEIPNTQKFLWRDRTWIKVAENHAVPLDGDPDAEREHVPNHETIILRNE